MQIKASRDDQARARREKAKALVESIAVLARLLALEVSSRANFLGPRIDDTAIYQFLAGNPYEDVAEAARAIPIHEQEAVPEVRLVFSLRKLVGLALETHTEFAAHLRKPLEERNLPRAPFDSILEALDHLEQQCRKRAQDLG